MIVLIRDFTSSAVFSIQYLHMWLNLVISIKTIHFKKLNMWSFCSISQCMSFLIIFTLPLLINDLFSSCSHMCSTKVWWNKSDLDTPVEKKSSDVIDCITCRGYSTSLLLLTYMNAGVKVWPTATEKWICPNVRYLSPAWFVLCTQRLSFLWTPLPI